MPNYLPTAESQLIGTLSGSNASINATDATPTFTVTFKDKNTNAARTPTSTTRIFVIDSGKDNFEIFYGTHTTASGVTTVTTTARGLPKDGATTPLTAVSANKKAHFAGAIVGCYDISTFLNLIIFKLNGTDTFDSDLTFAGDNTVSNSKKLKFGGANSYIWTENTGTDLKFKDANNSETTLSQLTAGAGTDTKVRVSAADTTSSFLDTKLTAGDGLSKTIVSPAGNEVLDLDIDLTDTVIFKNARSTNEIRVPITAVGDGKLDKTFMPTYLEDLIDSGTTVAEIDQALDGIGASVTAANLTDVTDSGTTILHKHLMSCGQTSRAAAAGTGTQNIAHGLGVTPSMVKITAYWGYTTTNVIYNGFSVGNATSTSTETCTYQTCTNVDTSATGGVTPLQDNAAIIHLRDSSAEQSIATLSVLDATNITLDFTTHRNLGTAVCIQWEAFA